MSEDRIFNLEPPYIVANIMKIRSRIVLIVSFSLFFMMKYNPNSTTEPIRGYWAISHAFFHPNLLLLPDRSYY